MLFILELNIQQTVVKIRSQYFCYISYQQEEKRPLDKGFMLHLRVLERVKENSYEGEVTAYITHFITDLSYLLEILHPLQPDGRDPRS